MKGYQSITKEQAFEKYELSSLVGRKVVIAVEFCPGSIDVEVGVIIDPSSIFNDGPETDRDLWVRVEQDDCDSIYSITMPDDKFLLCGMDDTA